MYVISEAPAATPLTVASGASTAAFSVIAGEPGAGTQCNLNLLGSNRLNGQPFTVRAAGYLTCSAGTYTSSATPLSFALYASNTASFAAASGNLQVSTTAIAIFTVTSSASVAMPWSIEVKMQGDNVSKVLGGSTGAIYWGTSPSTQTIATPLALAATANALTNVNMAAEPPAQFCAGIISAASNGMTGPVVTLTNFVLEA